MVHSVAASVLTQAAAVNSAGNVLPAAEEVLVVCAHPDDESFGLGAVIGVLSEQAKRVRVLCFTHGEASTLGDTSRPLSEVRAEEFSAAADILGIEDAELLSYPDGHLAEESVEELAHQVEEAVGNAELFLVFDEGGITGHPDHSRATQAAVLAAERCSLPVLAWALPEGVATQLNSEYGATFVGRPKSKIDIIIDGDRARQKAAIECHASQSSHNPVLWRRLELLGSQEHLRWLLKK